MNTIDSLFQTTGDCCGLYSSDLNQMIAQYYLVASPMMFKINDSIYADEIYGKDASALYDTQNDFNYLLMLLVMIYFERQDDILWSDDGEDEGIEYYYNNHNLACIRRNFMCKGFDIIGLLRTFDMDPDNPNNGNRGIGFMGISSLTGTFQIT